MRVTASEGMRVLSVLKGKAQAAISTADRLEKAIEFENSQAGDEFKARLRNIRSELNRYLSDIGSIHFG